MLGQIYLGNYDNKYFYVGKHDGDIFKDNYKGSGLVWCNILNKHKDTPDKFSFVVLEEYDFKEHGDQLEISYILKYKNLYGDKLVNIASGGQGGNLGDEVNRRISLAVGGSGNGMYGKKLSDESKKKISSKLKGHPNYNYSNWHPTEEMKQAQRERVLGDKNPCRREDVKQKLREAALKQTNRKGGKPGSYWFTNGIESKCYYDGEQPDGWYRGRTIIKK